MSDNKKYYYLKLKDNFFDREEIKVIRGMDKGDTYINIMLEMYLRSLKRGGQLMMTDTIPFNLKTLSAVLSRSEDEVKYAIDIFTEFRLLDVLDSGAMFMSDIQNFIGSSSSEGDRKRAYRAKISDSKDDLGHLSDNRPPEIKIEKEIELEIETEINIEKEKSSVCVFDCWNSQSNTTTHRSHKKDVESAYKSLLKDKYTEQEILTAINAYNDALGTNESWLNHKWTLKEFLTRENACRKFIDCNGDYNWLKVNQPAKTNGSKMSKSESFWS